MKNIFLKAAVFLMMLTTILWGAGGCKKFPDPGLNIQEYKPATDSSNAGLAKRKVLLISVDGLNAPAVNAVQPPTISSLLAHAKFTFDYSRSWQQPFPINNTSSWASMLTGEPATRMWDSSFYAVPNDTTNTVPVPANITVLQYLKERRAAAYRIIAVAPWNNLLNTFLRHADKKVVTGSDAETKNMLITALQSDSADLYIAQFKGVQEAGSAFGFGNNETADYPTQYRDAINTTDGYIGEVVKAVRERPSYENENWLTIITTTQVSYELIRRNITPENTTLINWFIIAHNDHFVGQNLAELKPAILPRIDEIAPNILYWLQVPVPQSMPTKNTWLSVFELEYGGK